MTKRPSKTSLVEEVEPGIGLYKYNPDDPNEEGQLRYLPGNPQGRQAGGAVSLHPWMTPITTTERAKELAERGKEKKQQAIEEGIQRAVEAGTGLKLSGPTEALSYIAAAQTNIALDPAAGMPSVKAAELMLRAVDALPDPRYNYNQQNIQINLNIDAAQLSKLEEQITTLEGEYIERKDLE